MKLEHITGGLVVAPDGLVIAADLPREVEAEPLSALAATLGRELELRGPRLRRGTFPMAQFASVSGTAHFSAALPWVSSCCSASRSADNDAVRAALRAAVGAVYRASGEIVRRSFRASRARQSGNPRIYS